MQFEYDENKSISNKSKHGIDFEEAKSLWNDENALVVPANIIDDEIRYALISYLDSKCYVAVFIIRDNKYRIISVRRCRKNEKENYANNNS